jgi:hypothetical protein
MTDYEITDPQEIDWGQYEEPDYEAIENRRCELEEEAIKEGIEEENNTIWSSWEKFLGK